MIDELGLQNHKLMRRYMQLHESGQQRELARVTLCCLRRIGGYVVGMSPRRLTLEEAAKLTEQDFGPSGEPFGRAAVLERVRGVLVKTSCRDVPQEGGIRLHEDLELDSAERIETAMQLEEEFGIALSDDEVDQVCMSTLGGITDYLMTQRGIG